ncbi:MAG: metal-dependent transcriptional regulator [Candidatus Marsarchaeota archaeon]|jgi:Mn-dependent DtxR family transcriptional regulator|nr:metal-dependent transcriptional regulator [Candidatus Marsarchaeota archaeon]
MGITRREKDCLAVIADEGSIKLTRLSKRLGIKPSTAYMLVKRLAGAGMVKRSKDGLVEMTRLGMEEEDGIRFRHRVIETLLARNGVGVKEACSECNKLDFLISNKTAIKIFEKLREPGLCPHGKPIRPVRN